MAPTRGGKQPLPDLLLVKEVASRLRVTEQFITNLLRRGEICGYRIGRLWRIDRADLESWLQKQRPRPFRLPIGSWTERAKSASPEWFGRLRMPEATGAPPFGFRGTEKTATFYSARGNLENVGSACLLRLSQSQSQPPPSARRLRHYGLLKLRRRGHCSSGQSAIRRCPTSWRSAGTQSRTSPVRTRVKTMPRASPAER